jgi:hypothetical protein
MGGSSGATHTGQPYVASTGQQFNREQFRDAWMGTGNNKAAQDALLAQYGLTLDGAGRSRLPTGEVIDLRIGAKAGGTQAGWGGTGADLKIRQTPSAPAPAASVSNQWNSALTNVAPGFTSPDPATNTIRTELYDLLMGRAKQGLDVSADDPAIKAQVDPYAAQQERARRNYLADLAEKSGPLANLRGEERLAMERAGQATGFFQAELVGREIQARRNEIAQALAQMGEHLTTEQKLALQRELALLDDATKRLSIESGERVGMAGVGAQTMAAQLANALGERRLDFDIEDRANYWDYKNKYGDEN